ncbi:hypothetical protein Tco_1071082 [Tanacetum coccineum]|uniref:Uncharacterized protein n=1 Tax=Tanacetum coccineum TaxID=301880 RepID=A0ABQ5HNG7_9ASTR
MKLVRNPKFTPSGYKWKPKSLIVNVNTNSVELISYSSSTLGLKAHEVWKDAFSEVLHVQIRDLKGNDLFTGLCGLMGGLRPLSVPRLASKGGQFGSISINRGLIQAIPTSLPPQPIGEAKKASNLRRIPPGIFLDYRVTLGFGSTGGLDLACPINRLSCHDGIQWVLGKITNSLPGNIMDEVHIEDLTIERYLRLTQENQTPKHIKDMTIADKSTLTHDPIWEFAHYFGPNQPDSESDCDSEDMEEEVKYMTDDEVVMSEQEESNHGYTQNIQHFEEKDDVDKWLNAEITKHMSMQGVENTEDALISIIKSIKMEMKDDIMKKQFEASTASISNETSSITSNEVDKDDNHTSTTTSYLLPKELSP